MDSMKLILLTHLMSLVMSSRLHVMHEENQEGIDDYPMAPEFEDVWTNYKNYQKEFLDVQSKTINFDKNTASLNLQEQVALIRKYWLLEMQVDLNTQFRTHDECPQLCMWCEPVKGEYEYEKTMLITRAAKKGIKQNLLGDTGQCGRVGFEAYINGKHKKGKGESFHTQPQWLSGGNYGLQELRRETTDETEKGYLKHCEWLRRKPFDVRHAVECMKLHSMCGSDGEAVGFPIPEGIKPKKVCRKASKYVKRTPLRTVTDLAALFKKAAKEAR